MILSTYLFSKVAREKIVIKIGSSSFYWDDFSLNLPEG